MRWLIIPVALLVLLAACGGGDGERIDALEERVAELEAELEATAATSTPTPLATATPAAAAVVVQRSQPAYVPDSDPPLYPGLTMFEYCVEYAIAGVTRTTCKIAWAGLGGEGPWAGDPTLTAHSERVT